MRPTDERIRAAFQVSAPQTMNDKLNQVYKTIREDEMKGNYGKRSGKLILLIAAVMMIFTVTALAASRHEDFFHTAYGTAVNDQEPYTVSMYDEDKDYTKIEIVYGTQRTQTAAEISDRLLGAYVMPLNLRTEIGEYTFTVQEIALDDNCIGAVTIDVENPNGHGLNKNGVYSSADGEFTPYSLCFETADGVICSHEIIADEDFSDTFAHSISYLTPFRSVEPTEEITLTIHLLGATTPSATAQLTFPALSRVPARVLSAENVRGEVSALGLRLTYLDADTAASDEYFEVVYSGIVIDFTNGESYTVYDDDTFMLNMMSFSGDSACANHWIAFNRLVDAETVSAVTLRCTVVRDASKVEKEVTLLP